MIDSICANRPAALAGLQPGDSITQLDGENIAYFDFKKEMLRRQKDGSAPHDITLTYVRAGVTDTITLATDSLYEMGVVARITTNQLLPVVRKEYSFLASLPAGAALGVKTLKSPQNSSSAFAFGRIVPQTYRRNSLGNIMETNSNAIHW